MGIHTIYPGTPFTPFPFRRCCPGKHKSLTGDRNIPSRRLRLPDISLFCVDSSSRHLELSALQLHSTILFQNRVILYSGILRALHAQTIPLQAFVGVYPTRHLLVGGGAFSYPGDPGVCLQFIPVSCKWPSSTSKFRAVIPGTISSKREICSVMLAW